MERDLLQTNELLKVDVDRKIDPVLIDNALLRTARRIPQNFAYIGNGELDALLLEWVG